MSAQIWTYLLVGFTFIYILIAIVSRAGSTKEFYVAGGGVNPIANGMATAADWMSAASFLSMAGLIAFMGFSEAVFMGWTGDMYLALLLAPYLENLENLRYLILLVNATIQKCKTCSSNMRFICFIHLRCRTDERVGVAFAGF